MTTNHSSRRRHRGRRGRRSGNQGAAQQQVQDQGNKNGADLAPVAVLPELADEPIVARPERRANQPASPQRPKTDQRSSSRPSRRRQPPRQPVGPMPLEVLKRGLEIKKPDHDLRLRPLASMMESETANFGCPMLNRNQVGLPSTGFQRAARCSLGWSLHDQGEALRCMYTVELRECWKAHPEHIESLDQQIQADEESPAAD